MVYKKVQISDEGYIPGPLLVLNIFPTFLPPFVSFHNLIFWESHWLSSGPKFAEPMYSFDLHFPQIPQLWHVEIQGLLGEKGLPKFPVFYWHDLPQNQLDY